MRHLFGAACFGHIWWALGPKVAAIYGTIYTLIEIGIVYLNEKNKKLDRRLQELREELREEIERRERLDK